MGFTIKCNTTAICINAITCEIKTRRLAQCAVVCEINERKNGKSATEVGNRGSARQREFQSRALAWRTWPKSDNRPIALTGG
jgi:hypothetical protein